MNNQTTNVDNGPKKEKKLNSQKLKVMYLLKHIAIPFTTMIGAFGLLIGFITAVHWSIIVTGNPGYTGYIFSNITTSMVLIIFAFLLAYSALPFFSGYLAVKIPNYKKIEETSSERHLNISIIVICVYIILYFLFYFTYKYLYHSIIYISVFLFLLFWGSIYYYTSIRKVMYDIKKSFCFLWRQKANRRLFSHKHIFRKMFAIPFTIFGFILYVAIGNIAGLVILLNDITDSSIGDVKVGVFSLFFVLGIPFLLTMSGIIYASNENKKQPLLISIIVSLSFFFDFI